MILFTYITLLPVIGQIFSPFVGALRAAPPINKAIKHQTLIAHRRLDDHTNVHGVIAQFKAATSLQNPIR